MSDHDAGDGPAQTEHRRQRRRATVLVIVGVVLAVVGLAGLVLTDPVTSSEPNQLRTWAVGVVLVGLATIVGALISRAAPLPEQRQRRPTRPVWLLLVAAGCGLATLISTVSLGRQHPLDYLSPVLLTVYPLAVYGYQSWRYRRSNGRERS